ncbi:DoxX family membrane protein [Halobaculum sp. CBA1158]|uniref:DoxX family membrane protein n=1 Tax=Halobaculum sp. CBA1158 TaxID=2904243 RepID=UPI001F3D5AE2|nr:DoxX family membrane protein [Halobaculum sp. CBA1158]UIO99260.1 DoxX family membrane protein [Halobaculum sp. CBA1158]
MLDTILLQSELFATAGSAEVFLLARLLFGLTLAFMGLNHFMQTDALAGYSEAKGLPAPRAATLFSGGLLLFGGLGVAAGALVALAAGGLAVFLLLSAVTIHDFWAVPEDQQQDQMTQFLKNVVMAGASLAFLALSGVSWPYALGYSVL